MRPTVPGAVSERPVDEDGILPWINSEAQKLLSRAKRALDYRGVESPAVTTTDATPTTIWSQDMHTDRGWHVEYIIQGYCNATGDYARYHEAKSIKRAAGAPTVVDTTAIEAAYEDVAGWDFTFTAGAGGTISLSVTGENGKDIDWTLYVLVLETPRS